MEYFLLATVTFLVLTIIWGILGFGVRNKTLIKNEKIVHSGCAICLIACVISWSIYVSYAIGFACTKTYVFFSQLM